MQFMSRLTRRSSLALSRMIGMGQCDQGNPARSRRGLRRQRVLEPSGPTRVRRIASAVPPVPDFPFSTRRSASGEEVFHHAALTGCACHTPWRGDAT